MLNPRFRRPVFTPVGGAVLVIALIVLIRSLLARNAYEIVLAVAALLLLLVLGVTGAWKSRKLKELEPGWKPPFPMTAGAEDETLATGFSAAIPLFFRLHFSVRGRFFPSGSKAGTKKGCSVLAETSVPRGETTTQLSLVFPLSGLFTGEGFCRLRDIFGFFSFPCGQPQARTVNVRCAPCYGKKTSINAQTGAEDRRNKPSADEERYYMREYTPGDRFRDINWKSSEKIDTLITRISTDNQEKISRIEVHFRNYSNANDSLSALWLLDRAKARLSYFLRSLMEQNSSFVFDVRAAGSSWEIEDMDDLEDFFEELAVISFSVPQNETATTTNNGDMYVFSTACDVGLPGFILTCNPRPVTLFMIQPENLAKNKKTAQTDEKKGGEYLELLNRIKTGEKKIGTEVLNITDFDFKGCKASPRWLIQRKLKPLGVQASRVEMFYAKTEIKI
ncbi:MAG: DUF58 domain-containing protein [Treponema sp.]|jgi:hypothetical protein|nr:DUF58 domain-containing protein [Treponema sp.]